MSEYECEDCGKQYKSRSGLWKHRQKCLHITVAEQPTEETAEQSEEFDVEDAAAVEAHLTDTETDNESWLDFDFGYSEAEATESIPSMLKAIRPPEGKRRKLTAKEQKARDATNQSLLVMALGGVDYAITRYGRAVTLDPEYECTHSDADKKLVAGAQGAYFREKGIDLANHIGSGHVALALTGYYIVPPVIKIQKKSKRPLAVLRSGGRLRGFLRRIRIPGFRKRTPPPTEVIVDDS